jgi:protein involved in polysaccharide export with SLBB domain
MELKRWASSGLLLLGVSSVVFAQNPPPPPPDTVPPVVVTPAQPTAAQRAAAAMGRPASNEQIADAIRRSGLNERQIRDRLRSAGYDPSLADAYFATPAPLLARASAAARAAAAAEAAQASDFAKALVTLGLITLGDSLPPDSVGRAAEATRRTAERREPRVGGLFGKDIFDRANTAFDPITAGPVDAAYRVGIGEVLQLVVTGQVELAYQLEVRRDGTVIIPQVGQVSLAGLTLEAARAVLKARMAKSYSGLESGEAHLDLSLARLRSNAVFVIGEVESPGAYQVNSLATVFHALARAGGPTDKGSFRDVEVRRAGKVVQRLDLYDYLLKGDAAGDVRLEQGDVVFVPLNARVVTVQGAVRRARIFELRTGEGFNDLLRFAGGLLPVASVDRVQIDRVLPSDRRTPGVERVKVDVELKGSLDSLARVTLMDGDIVKVFTVGELRRNVVTLTGQVYQPGEFELKPGMTLGRLMDEAQGPMPWALADRVKVVRTIVPTGRSELRSVDATTPAGRAFELKEFDAIEVLDGRTAFATGQIVVEGAVHNPTARPFVERESLRDAIERSGGLKEEAQAIDVSRRRVGPTYSDTTSVQFRFEVTPDFKTDPRVGQFLLERDDHVMVRTSPGFRPQQFVTVEGQFKYTGSYAITANRDRVRDLVQRAGDVLPESYPESFRLVRDGKQVSVDFARAMQGDPVQNIPLLGGDRLAIERDPKTVFVTGAVSQPSLIRYRPGLSAGEYIELAGGPTENGDAGKAVVVYPSGFSKRVKRVAWFFHSSPDVVSGATISVPEKPPSKPSTSDVWARVLTTAATLASLVIAYSAVKK